MKKLSKILLYLLLIFILLFTIFLVRNIIIINILSKKAQNLDYSNYQLKVSHYYNNSIEYTDVFFNKGKYIQKITSLNKSKNLEKDELVTTYTSFDGKNTVITLYSDNTIGGERNNNSKPIYCLENFNRLSLLTNDDKLNFISLYFSIIKKEQYKNNDVYVFNNNFYVDFNTGLMIKYIINDDIYEIEYNFDKIDDKIFDIYSYK